MESLLPPNATPQERALAEGMTRLSAVPVPVDTLWGAATCPVALLPWLAWALSVDEWDSTWTEAQKRGAVASAIAIHRRKGTRGALNRAISALGYSIRVVEWWEEAPEGQPGTFRVLIEIDDRGVDDSLIRSLERIVLKTKNTRSHLAGITMAGRSAGHVYVGAHLMSGDVVTVDPWMPASVSSQGALYVGGCFALYETVTVNPVVI